jgi:hypothetical protein
MRSRCPFIWLRLFRIKAHPWINFIMACWQVIRTCGHPSESTRLAIALAKLDHLGIVSLLNDCLW